MVVTAPNKIEGYLREIISKYRSNRLTEESYNTAIDYVNRIIQDIKFTLNFSKNSNPETHLPEDLVKESQEVCKNLEVLVKELSTSKNELLK